MFHALSLLLTVPTFQAHSLLHSFFPTSLEPLKMHNDHFEATAVQIIQKLGKFLLVHQIQFDAPKTILIRYKLDIGYDENYSIQKYETSSKGD